MYTADYDTMLSTIRTAAQTIAKGHYNHSQRDSRLQALQRLIWRYTRMHTADAEKHNALRQLYEMCFGHVDYETHSDIRARCYLIVEMAELEIDQYHKQQEEARNKFRWVSPDHSPHQPDRPAGAAAKRDNDLDPAVWDAALGDDDHTPDDDFNVEI